MQWPKKSPPPPTPLHNVSNGPSLTCQDPSKSSHPEKPVKPGYCNQALNLLKIIVGENETK